LQELEEMQQEGVIEELVKVGTAEDLLGLESLPEVRKYLVSRVWLDISTF